MLVKDVEACSFANWYDKFKKVTFKSIIVPIPPEVLTYLRSDGTLVLKLNQSDVILYDVMLCLVKPLTKPKSGTTHSGSVVELKRALKFF